MANRTNLIAEFSRDLLAQGYTSIPNLLIKSYRDLGINDLELLILINIIFLQSKEDETESTQERLTSLMSSSAVDIESSLKCLQEKKFLTPEQKINSESLNYKLSFNLEGLFDRLAEVWAIERNKEFEEQQRLLSLKLKNDHNQQLRSVSPSVNRSNTLSEQTSFIYQTFENEFGRPLSPMESELIIQWCTQLPSELVLEALKISVVQGTFNLRYIERILQDWQRKNIRTLREVRELDEAFSEKKASQAHNSGRSNPAIAKKTAKKSVNHPKEDKYRDLYSI